MFSFEIKRCTRLFGLCLSYVPSQNTSYFGQVKLMFFLFFCFRFSKCVQRHSIFGVDLMCVACLGFFRCCVFFGLSMLLYLVWIFRFKPSSARYPVAIYGVCSISNLKVFSCFLVLNRRTKLFHESVYSQWIFLCFFVILSFYFS